MKIKNIIFNLDQSLRKLLWRLIDVIDTRDTKLDRRRETLDKNSGKKEIHVSVYQTVALSNRRGRTPEQVAAKFIAQAFEDAGVDYRIDYGFEREYTPPEKHTNSRKTFFWWVEREKPISDADTVLLLTDSSGGGLGASPHAMAGANEIRRDVTPRVNCTSPTCNNMKDILHEIGHTLGGEHETPILKDDELLYHPNMVSLLNNE